MNIAYFGLSNCIAGILFIVISLPLVLEKIPMNSLYGVRFKKSYESEENWYKINRYGGKQLIYWSTALILLGLITFFSPLAEIQSFNTISAFAPLIVFVPAYKSYKYAQNL